MTVYCDNADCKYNEQQKCECSAVYYVDRLCVTFRHIKRENYRELMKAPGNPKCHKAAGKYKSDHANIIR